MSASAPINADGNMTEAPAVRHSFIGWENVPPEIAKNHGAYVEIAPGWSITVDGVTYNGDRGETFWSFFLDDLMQALPMLGVALGAACVGFIACLYVSLPLIQMTMTKPISDRDTFTIPLGIPTPDGCAIYRSAKFTGAGIKRCPWEFVK